MPVICHEYGNGMHVAQASQCRARHAHSYSQLAIGTMSSGKIAGFPVQGQLDSLLNRQYPAYALHLDSQRSCFFNKRSAV